MNTKQAWRAVLLASSLLAAALAQGAQPVVLGPNGLDGLDASAPRAAAANAPRSRIKTLSQSAKPRVSPRVIVLPVPSAKQATLPTPAPGQPRQTGFGRALPDAADAAATAGLLTWTRDADGSQRAAISVQAPGARGLRLGLRVEELPPQAVLRVYAPSAAQTVEIAAAEVLRTIQTNLDAGATGDAARIYWLPIIEGAEAALEIELPAGVSPAQLKVSLPRVSHLVMLATGDEPAMAAANEPKPRGGTFIPSPGICNVHAMCAPEDVSFERHAVALIGTTDEDGFSHHCTGTLLNNTRQDRTPYFLTAQHCVPTQARASTMYAQWNHSYVSCGRRLDPDRDDYYVGGTLLYASADNDIAFLRLEQDPPDTATFAGWKPDAPAGVGTRAFTLHHPQTDLLRYSAGEVTGFDTCTRDASSRWVQCTGTDKTPGEHTFYEVVFSQGVVEPVSSGSALFASNGRQIIGQASSINEKLSCDDPSQPASYGRFDLAYKAGNLAQWLDPGPEPTYTVTASAGEGGTISPSGVILVKQGASVTFTAQAEPGYVVSGINGCDGVNCLSRVYVRDSPKTVDTYTTEPITANSTVKVSFEEMHPKSSSYIVTASAGEGGTISPSGAITVKHGETVTFTAQAEPGYVVSGFRVCNTWTVYDYPPQDTTSTLTSNPLNSNCTAKVSFQKAAPITNIVTVITDENKISQPVFVGRSEETFPILVIAPAR
ncbi:MAG: trypsin-like peptidase domain-containing protein [Burkholderiaceae bacterium]|nr:trypsin-like peptidase domain-containing protein [Burkholderiaceae bacterium]